MRQMYFALALFGAFAAGCTGPHAFQAIDLDRDLDPAALARYEAEWTQSQAAGGGPGMAQLEHTNWWPLGIVAYWYRGSVSRMASAPGAPSYHVSRTDGVGPLSVLYVSQTHSTFRADGGLMSRMNMISLLWGHLAMFEHNDVLLADGRRQESSSAHLIHHILNFHRVDGHTSVSLFSSPNLVGVDVHSSGGGHSH